MNYRTLIPSQTEQKLIRARCEHGFPAREDVRLLLLAVNNLAGSAETLQAIITTQADQIAAAQEEIRRLRESIIDRHCDLSEEPLPSKPLPNEKTVD